MALVAAHPHLDHFLEIYRRRWRNGFFGAATGHGRRLWVALGWLAARHSCRSLTANPSITCSTAARRRAGLSSFQ